VLELVIIETGINFFLLEKIRKLLQLQFTVKRLGITSEYALTNPTETQQ